MRIVVIEDEDNTRDGIIKLIGRLGAPYEVVGDADDGAKGLALIETTSPDLVITDIKMPEFSGIDMLDDLKRRGHRHQTVILTGFSQYEYAKKALGLGVLEFLEKPITAEDLKLTLEKAEQELRLQQMAGVPQGTAAARLEHYLQQAVTLSQADPAVLAPLLEQAAGFKPGAAYWLATVYAGQYELVRMPQLKSKLTECLACAEDVRHFAFAVPQEASLALLLQSGKPDAEVARFIDRELKPLVHHSAPHAAVSTVQVPKLEWLKAGFDRLTAARKWFVTIDEQAEVLHIAEDGSTGGLGMVGTEAGVGIGAERRTPASAPALAAAKLIFPHALENKVKKAISTYEPERLEPYFAEWLEFCFTGRYEPQHILDGTVRLATSALQMIGETYGDEWVFRLQKAWLQPVLESHTRHELKAALEGILRDIAEIGERQVQPSYSLIVQKALKIVHERFREGITLEETAAVLRITPEYLSAMFAKEVGSHFSAYLKHIRISHAKKLLQTTEFKMFEIAKLAGYPDPKYFSRVFKEVTGLSPAEYQRMLNKD
ncbi:response regulator transcription factor [Paenibacillus macerans]|uniref:response regulator transcription factor n=1 Tax=Paenibacillus macerans TaxID=44252 RepID=UPI003D315C09